MRATKIDWIDPTVYSEWTHIDDVVFGKDVNIIKSVGYIVKEDERFLMISLSVDDGEGERRVNCAKVIPKSCIKHREDFDG